MSLFKYLSSSNLQPLENRQFRFTQPIEFNDPFEVRPHFSAMFGKHDIVELINEHKDTKFDDLFYDVPFYLKLFPRTWLKRAFLTLINSNPDIFRERMKEVEKKISPLAQDSWPAIISKDVGILCLSKNPENILMWSHYADSHSGVLVEFDEESEFFNQSGISSDNKDIDKFYGKVLPVTYRRSRPTFEFFDKSWPDMFFTKSIDWAYEEEHRMLMPLSEANRVINDKIYLFEIPAKAFKAVYFGVNFPTAKIIDTIESVKRFNKEVKFYQAYLSKTKYDIEYRVIES
ncbi:DUF2971 domain-containing protein [Vibrio parahaemolyticus]